MGVKPGDAKHDAAGGLLDVLTPERARKLRADAWRYVRRIDARTARRIWRACREREPAVSLARHAKRRDANQREIVEALERVGAEVWILDRPCDLAVWFRRRWYMLETKLPHGRFSRLQTAERAQGLCEGIQTVTTAPSALKCIGAMT